MRTGLLQSLILAVTMLAGAGCKDSQSSSSSQPSATEPCSPVLQHPPVFYRQAGDPSKHRPALSESELTRIVDSIAAETKGTIWFIRVNPSWGGGKTLIVYLAPEKETPRIREGSAYSMRLSEKTTSILLREEYIQVSKVDQTFAKQLTLPSTSDLPFSRPNVIDPNSKKSSPMPEEELVRIVDFVRRPSSYENLDSARGAPSDTMIKEIQEMPVLGVINEQGEIQVYFGFQDGPVSGYGLKVQLESTSTGYRVVDWSDWIS